MTRRDFELIATVVRNFDPYPFCGPCHHDREGYTDADVRQSLARHLSTALESVNPRFDRERFLAACRREGK